MLKYMRRAAALVLLTLVAIGARAAFQTPTQRADALVASLAGQDEPGLVLGVWKDGHVIYRGARGMADLEQSSRLSSTTPFHLASLSKQFTGLMILKLVAAGKVDLEADIHQYLPELPDYGASVRVEHLLHMVSGLKDQWALMLLSGRGWHDVLTQDELLSVTQRVTELDFAPGSDYAYSNTNYMLLAEIIARVSGSSFREVIEREVFHALSMRSSLIFNDVSELLPGRANSYYRFGETGKWHRDLLAYDNYGATSAHSTLDDMLKWGIALSATNLGGKPLFEALTQPTHLAYGRPIVYGAGLYRTKALGRDAIEHAGADASFRSAILYFPAEQLGVVVLANRELQSLNVAVNAASIWLQTPQEHPAVKWLGDPTADAQGVYAGGRTDGAIEIKSINGSWRMTANAASDESLIPSGLDCFNVEGENTELHLLRDGSGHVIALEEHNASNPLVPYILTRRRLHKPSYSAEASSAFLGTYRNAALDVSYQVDAGNGELYLQNLQRSKRFLMQPTDSDRFELWDYAFRTLTFSRSGAQVTGFTLTGDRATNVRFERTD